MENCDQTSRILREDEQFLDDIVADLNNIGTNLHNFVNVCSNSSPILDSDFTDTNQLASEIDIIHNDVGALVEPLKHFKKNAIDEITKLEARCAELTDSLSSQQNELSKAMEEITRLRNQVMHQSTFCASLGAVLGNLVWRASRLPEVINVWLSGFQNKVGEFLSIVNGTFVSFVKTYGNTFPSVSSDESQFVLGLCGIVTNISASPQGRQFLVINPNGKNLLEKLVHLMPMVPLPSGSSLKRLMLMILYNVSINQTGLKYLLDLRIGAVLGECVDHSAPVELKLLCLRLLQSITFELTDQQTINDILSNVPIDRIAEIRRNDFEDRREMASLASEVLARIEALKVNFQ